LATIGGDFLKRVGKATGSKNKWPKM